MNLTTVIGGWWRVASELLQPRTGHFPLITAFKEPQRARSTPLATVFRPLVTAIVLLLLLPLITPHSSLMRAQSESASLSGTIVDRQGGLVPDAQVSIVNTDTNVAFDAKTNNAGVYNAPFLKPGRYRILVTKQGFKKIDIRDVTLNVQDSINRNFTLDIGGTSETVIVNAGAPLIETQGAAVSTVVDRQFAENLPMNGRSFQTLIQLTPGVVVTASNELDSGQFSVNGQRAASNYWMVDGVSANIGLGVTTGGNPGNGLSGSLGSFSAMGGTNSLVSVDAMQEFRIQTSTYAPEFGRTPGGQISIVTRSGTNQVHGTLFDYFRNDALDANNWFNTSVTPALPKAQERQNDFGGTLSGPAIKDKTFFFFSYEGLRLRLPQTTLTTVPSANPADPNARQNAVPALQPYLSAFPLPNGPQAVDGLGNPVPGAFDFNASYSNPATLDAYSLRVDHKLKDKLILFGRYNYSPSEIVQRGGGNFALSTVSPLRITTATATVGATWAVSPTVVNDLRFNYSKTDAASYAFLDNFGGAVPLAAPPFPSPFTTQEGLFSFAILSLQQNGNNFQVGRLPQNHQRQTNVVDSLSMQKGPHSLKFGGDFRRLSPTYSPQAYQQGDQFSDVPSTGMGNLNFSDVTFNLPATFLFRNLGIYAQDTWRVSPRFTLTYGLRWDVDFVPSTLSGPSFPSVTGFDLVNFSNLALARPGTSPFNTTYGNLAPRVGFAYQLTQSQGRQTAIRGGFGVFYDLATSEMGNQVGAGNYPFGSFFSPTSSTFPLDPAMAAPAPIAPPDANNFGTLFAIDPHLQLPYTLEWNVALEQGLGQQQSISASYIGAAGRRLLQSSVVLIPNVVQAQLLSNTGTSDYDALQVQFQRRLSRGLQALTSYTWAHSIDTTSAGSIFVGSNLFEPPGIGGSNRGPSSFDIRNALSAGVTYDIPVLKIHHLTNAVLGGWSIQSLIQYRSAPPVDVSDQNFNQFNHGFTADIRPDLVPGKPLYLYRSKYPGGKAFNPNAFTDPPTDPNTGNPIRQGTLGRNALRGFGAAQWDLAIHRDFPLSESLHLQFRGELFNVLNHPNFGPPSGQFGVGGFGLSSQMLGQSLSGTNVGGGAFSPLYQLGGPRSVQLALKLQF
jgi:hypothetical protein